MRRIDLCRPTIALCLIATALLGTSCATLRGMAARNAHLKSATEQFVFSKPLRKVWPQVRSTVFALGLSVKDTGEAANYTLETEIKNDDQDTSSNAVQKRYLIQGIEQEAEQCSVQISSSTREGRASREWRMEWDLIQKIDPAGAARIQAEAEEVAQI